MSGIARQPLRSLLDRIGERLAKHRLNRNLTQAELARIAGISPRTLIRLENGEPTQLENFLRAVLALGLEEGLDRLVPDVPISPIQRLRRTGRGRLRASGRRKPPPEKAERWSWGDDA
jgi:transcriptional regulator with XRE-family HTH domain